MLLSFTDTFFRKTFKLSKSPSRYCTGSVQGSHFTDKVFISTPMTPDRRPCVPCVPCVSRLPPVSFYRRTGTVLSQWRGAVDSGPAAVLAAVESVAVSAVARSCGCVVGFGWLVVRFVRVIRVLACARVSCVSRVCPGSPRCLFTGTVHTRGAQIHRQSVHFEDIHTHACGNGMTCRPRLCSTQTSSNGPECSLCRRLTTRTSLRACEVLLVLRGRSAWRWYCRAGVVNLVRGCLWRA